MKKPSNAATPAATLGAALQAVAMSELATIDAALSRGRARHRGVHEARKAIRRLRALLALGDDAFGDAGEALDATLSRIGKSLSVLRDAQVVVDTARRIGRRADQASRRDVWLRLRAALAERRAQTLARAIAADPQFGRRRQRVQALRPALAALPWRRLDRREVVDALTRQARRSDKAQRRAEAHRGARERHRWRRRLRRLRMQMDLIKTLAQREPPTATAADAYRAVRRAIAPPKRLGKQADALGRGQDEEILRRAVRALAPGELRAEGLKALRRAV